MKLWKSITLSSMVAALVLVLSACPTQPSSSSAPAPDNSVTVNFDFSGTYDPQSYGVVPFIVGEVSAYIDGAYDWDAATNGGITAAGTGPQVLSYDSSSGLYSIKLTPTNSGAAVVRFKAANYSTNDWANVVGNFWNTVGSQNTGTDNEELVISNYTIVKKILKDTTNDVNAKSVTIDVAADGGWGLDISGNTTADINVVLIWTNVSDNGYSGTGTPADTLWYPLLSVESNTNTGATTAAKPVVTGNSTWLHTDGTSTWTTSKGKPLTVDAANHKLSVSLTVPSGSSRSVQYKAACELDWNRGEQKNNVFLPLPESSTTTITNIVPYDN